MRRDRKRVPEATGSPPGHSKSRGRKTGGSTKVGYRLLKRNIWINITAREASRRDR